MGKKILIQEVKEFLCDFEKNSQLYVLEEGKEKKEILKIAENRGINLANNTDLAPFKCIFAFADKPNKNGAYLPEKELLKALPSMVGKPVNANHDRLQILGHLLDYRYQEKGKKVIAYGVFYKSNLQEKYEEAKTDFEDKKLNVSFEIWSPKDKQKLRPDGSRELREMEVAGMAILFRDEDPAFDGAKVLEFSKKLKEESPELVFASKYKEDEIICSNYFEEEVKKNYERLKKEREEEIKETEKKEEQPKEEKVKEEPKQVEQPKEEQKPKEEVKEIDFKLLCPTCTSQDWLLEDEKENSAEIKCNQCSKEYLVNFKTVDSETDGEKLKEKLAFVYNSYAQCPQCQKTISICGTSKIDKYELKCDRCELEFTYNKAKDKKFRQIKSVREILDEEKTKKEEPEVKEEKKIEEKVEEQKTPQSETPEEEKVEKTEEQPKEEVKEEKKEEKVEEKEEIKETETEEPKAEEEKVKSSEEKEEKIEEEPAIVEVEKPETNEIEEESSEEKPKYYKTGLARAALIKSKKIKAEIEKELEEAKNLAETYKKGIKKTASLVISSKEEITKIKEEAEEKITFYKENAKKIVERRTALGDSAKDLSDKDIVDDEKFEKALLKKENELLRSKVEGSSETVGDKIIEKDEEWYSQTRKAIDEHAFGKN